jgi:hypothetical protein
MVDEIQRQRSFSPEMRRMGRREGSTPMRNPIDMAPPRRNPDPDFRAGPYKPLPITPDYERPMPMPLPIPPNYERPMPMPLPIRPDYGTGPMPTPMPQPPFTPKELDDYFKRRRGFNTSETARENFISRTDGGYPNRQDPSFMDRYGDYIDKGLEYMPTPFPGITLGTGSRILRGLGSLYGGNAAEYIDELPATPLQEDDEASGIMRALPTQEGYGETAGIYQQWKKIADKFGEVYANDWLASQQAV